MSVAPMNTDSYWRYIYDKNGQIFTLRNPLRCPAFWLILAYNPMEYLGKIVSQKALPIPPF